MNIDIQGECDERFEFLRDMLAQELRSGRALGQAVAVVAEGKTVAHLWGGHADSARTRPWAPDTLVCLFSAGKPLAAACVLKLIERGRMELDAPVARYWPEFAQNGKSEVTVRHALAHLAGVPIAEAAPARAVYDRAALARAIEVQRPLWPAGSQLCFHSFTHGILSGELVRRVDGRCLPEFFRQEFAAPFELELGFALDTEQQQRCADVVLVEDNPLFRMMTDPSTTLGQSWQPMPWQELNSREFRECDFPSIAGHGSALGLARFYSAMACGGRIGARSLLGEAIVREALSEQRHEPDIFMGAPVRMGLSFMLHSDIFRFTGSAASFGQPGLGGVAGIGDSQTRIGIGVTCNRLGAEIDNPLLDQLLQAVAANA